ncbi:MAG: tRNA preQ1(34) S-adenosylmethionine ribosyltransferase-isomerase QueA [Magnetococcales bacterium]|nr:tRNA preQ1(34) S-adenosylmethionine ribosyltransferase-isomerase QueA [Magnetococcales bacterium]NGZ06990.1 tRNA preQ1(34) S-adenosylmethionine ribosyltransferase-isomerase QueA [Magnetococcales bacterium]
MPMEPAWRLSDFDYPLPREQIAQRPVTPRDAARLLVSRPEKVVDGHFTDLTSWLQAGDLLVLNDTRVIPARLHGRKSTGGEVEILLSRPLAAGEEGVWEALLRSHRPVRPGAVVHLAPGFDAEVLGRDGDRYRIGLHVAHGDLEQALERYGALPLPPYIVASDPVENQHRYQTVFACHPGAVAAPTAGLHFTPELLATLDSMGVGRVMATLHVGLGTFQPVRHEDLSTHVMHREFFVLSAEVANAVAATRQAGGRVVAVGTTVARMLESSVGADGRVEARCGETDLFILPGFRFRAVDLLITNFHLPKSTLLMLIAAFVGKGRQERDYAHAVAAGYRFFSYGDANLLFPESAT